MDGTSDTEHLDIKNEFPTVVVEIKTEPQVRYSLSFLSVITCFTLLCKSYPQGCIWVPEKKKCFNPPSNIHKTKKIIYVTGGKYCPAEVPRNIFEVILSHCCIRAYRNSWIIAENLMLLKQLLLTVIHARNL